MPTCNAYGPAAAPRACIRVMYTCNAFLLYNRVMHTCNAYGPAAAPRACIRVMHSCYTFV